MQIPGSGIPHPICAAVVVGQQRLEHPQAVSDDHDRDTRLRDIWPQFRKFRIYSSHNGEGWRTGVSPKWLLFFTIAAIFATEPWLSTKIAGNGLSNYQQPEKAPNMLTLILFCLMARFLSKNCRQHIANSKVPRNPLPRHARSIPATLFVEALGCLDHKPSSPPKTTSSVRLTAPCLASTWHRVISGRQHLCICCGYP